jgi:hypothetical protein
MNPLTSVAPTDWLIPEGKVRAGVDRVNDAAT